MNISLGKADEWFDKNIPDNNITCLRNRPERGSSLHRGIRTCQSDVLDLHIGHVYHHRC